MSDAEKLICDALNSLAALCVNPTSPRDDLAAAFPQLENPADREELAAAMEILRDAARAAICLRKQRDALLEALKGIRQYGSDTLSGPEEGLPTVEWVREGVVEIVNRADAAIAMTEDKS